MDLRRLLQQWFGGLGPVPPAPLCAQGDHPRGNAVQGWSARALVHGEGLLGARQRRDAGPGME